MKSALLMAATLASLAAAAPVHAGSFTLSTDQVEPDTRGFDSATTANLRYGVEVEGATDISSGETANGRDLGSIR